MKTLTTIMLLVIIGLLTGCNESYSRSGTQINHRYQPNTSDALRAIGEIGYQSSGQRKGVTPQQYQNNMRGLGALGTLMDFMSH